ncbi:MAG: hypothetical protein WCF36_19340, partial [Candidatus Nanopelagicales bacterium]
QGPSTASWDWLLAASEDTVWVSSGDRWYRGERGSWVQLGPPATVQGAVLASDGALWARTGDSQSGPGDLIRIEGETATVVARDVHAAALFAGDNGEVWLGQTPTDQVVGFRADTSIQSIDPPEGMDEVCLRSASSDGSLYVTEEIENKGDPDRMPCESDRTWARWNGQRWEAVELPPSLGSFEDDPPRFIGVNEDVAWSYSLGGSVLRRYAEGREREFDVSPALVLWPFGSTAPARGMCGFEFRGEGGYDNDEEPKFIVCFDEAGESARFEVAGLGLTGFSVAPDGSVWVKGAGASWASSDNEGTGLSQAPQKVTLLAVPVP